MTLITCCNMVGSCCITCCWSWGLPANMGLEPMICNNRIPHVIIIIVSYIKIVHVSLIWPKSLNVRLIKFHWDVFPVKSGNLVKKIFQTIHFFLLNLQKLTYPPTITSLAEKAFLSTFLFLSESLFPTTHLSLAENSTVNKQALPLAFTRCTVDTDLVSHLRIGRHGLKHGLHVGGL